LQVEFVNLYTQPSNFMQYCCIYIHLYFVRSAHGSSYFASFDVAAEAGYPFRVRKLLRVLVIVFGLLFAGLVLWTVVVLDSVGRSTLKPALESVAAPTVFHFIALMPSLDRDLYHIRVLNGMTEAAERIRSTVQVIEYRPGEGPERIKRQIRMIAAVKPDGVALALPSDQSYDEAIASIAARRIPVVTVETDQSASLRRAHVGTNSFEAGKLAGGALAARFPEGAEVALLLALQDREAANRDTGFVMGFRQAVKNRPDVRLALVRTAREGSAAGEELVREFLLAPGAVDAVVFTSARDAEGAAQALVEYGKVGALALLGYDDTPEIRKHIKTGVIFASLARNPERAGEAAVESLAALAGGERTGAYVDTGITLLTSELLGKERSP